MIKYLAQTVTLKPHSRVPQGYFPHHYNLQHQLSRLCEHLGYDLDWEGRELIAIILTSSIMRMSMCGKQLYTNVIIRTMILSSCACLAINYLEATQPSVDSYTHKENISLQ